MTTPFMRSLSLFCFGFLVFFTPQLSIAATATLGAPIATINIQDAKIVSQEGNLVTVSFALTNREGAQSGVRYGIKLVHETSNGQTLVDEKAYDESISIGENQKIERTVEYAVPAQLSGKYALVLFSSNNAGFPFGINYVGDVTVTAMSGVSIAPETCVLTVESEPKKTPYNVLQGVDITAEEKLLLNCSVINSTDKQMDLRAMFETRTGTAYGELVDQTSKEEFTVTLAAGEKKTLSFVLPKASSPGAYYVKSWLQSGVDISNTVIAQYKLSGVSGSIQNVSVDNTSFEKGDTAMVSLIWTGVAQVPGSRLAFSAEPVSYVAEVTIKNRLGGSCAEPSTTIMEGGASTQTNIMVPLTAGCNNPIVSVTLKDNKGTVLDEEKFSFTSGTEQPFNKNLGIILAIIGLLAIGTFIYRRTKHKGMVPPTVPLALLFLGMLFPFSDTHADTFMVGQYNLAYAAVNINKSIYNPGEMITTTGTILSISGAAYNVYIDVSMSASTNGGPSVSIIDPTMLGFISGGNAAVFGTALLTAPTTPGGYNTVFSAGIDEYAPVNQPPALVDYSPGASFMSNSDYDYNQPIEWDEYGYPIAYLRLTEQWFNGSFCLDQTRSVDTDIQVFSPYGSTPFIEFTIPAGQACVNADDTSINNLTSCVLPNSNPTGKCYQSYEDASGGSNGVTSLATTDFGCLYSPTREVGTKAGAECVFGQGYLGAVMQCPGGSSIFSGPTYVFPQFPQGWDIGDPLQPEEFNGSYCSPMPISPADICPNLAGNQTHMPANFLYDMYGNGTCVTYPHILGSSRTFNSAGEACGAVVSRALLGQNGPFNEASLVYGGTVYTDSAASQPLNGQNKWIKVSEAWRPSSIVVQVANDGSVLDHQLCD